MGYVDRKVAGLCTYGSCKAHAADGSNLCASHAERERRRKQRGGKSARKVRREHGMCAECGRVKSKTYRCAACDIEYRQKPSQVAKYGAPTTNPATNVATRAAAIAERVAAATRVDGDNRSRYHGRVDRGPPPKAALDEQTLVWIIEHAGKCLHELKLARTAYADRPKAERKAAEREALSHVELARRFAEEVLERNRYDEEIDRMVPG